MLYPLLPLLNDIPVNVRQKLADKVRRVIARTSQPLLDVANMLETTKPTTTRKDGAR